MFQGGGTWVEQMKEHGIQSATRKIEADMQEYLYNAGYGASEKDVEHKVQGS